MRKFLVAFCMVVACAPAGAQPDSSVAEAQRILSFLASDLMKGRATYSTEIDEAAKFIAKEFNAATIKPWDDSSGFFQDFVTTELYNLSIEADFDGVSLPNSSIVALTSRPEISVDEGSGIPVWRMSDSLRENDFFHEAVRLVSLHKDLVVVVPPALHRQFYQLYVLYQAFRFSSHLVVFVKLDKQPGRFVLKIRQDTKEKRLTNVIGYLPGRSRPDEYVIFSAHYDHIGTGNSTPGDTIYNGANDNASGVTALLLLAKHFGKINNNERSILFIAFSGEELGLVGSGFFANTFPVQSVVSVINLEMLGSGYGSKRRRSAYVTGSEQSNLLTIMNKELGDQAFRFVTDPFPLLNLFERSDNFSFARKAVIAHSIMSTNFTNYHHYHQASDETKYIDFQNIVAVVNALKTATAGIIAGRSTPELRK